MRILLFISVLVCVPVMAQATLAEVSSPRVQAHRALVEWRGSYAWDNTNESVDHRFQQRVLYDYGFNDTLAVRISTTHERQAGESLRHRMSGAELRLQLLERGEANAEAGIRLFYNKADGASRPDNAGAIVIGDYRDGALLYRGNLVVTHAMGAESRAGVAVETRAMVSYALAETHHLALESFNNFGRLRDMRGFDNQQHSVGPVLIGWFDDRHAWEYNLGLQRALSDAAPDWQTKLFLSYEF